MFMVNNVESLRLCFSSKQKAAIIRSNHPWFTHFRCIMQWPTCDNHFLLLMAI